ncbi:MAG: OmpA family protein, partial [Hyphomicrobium sp.]|nr:OmpA family protein [Hyphomicrobium sp.]
LGLVPKPADALDATRRLREALPASQVTDQTAALPGGLAEARAQIGALSDQVAALSAAGMRSAQETNDALAALTAELKRSREDTSRLEAQITKSTKDSAGKIAALQADVTRLSRPSAGERLAEWVHTNAIFYDKETDFRDERAAAALDELAALLKETKAFVRVVGHTDEKGGQTHNSPLSLARATKVAAELRRRGVPAAQLIAVGRNDVANLSPTIGNASPNRRVEFEIGFKHETPQ